MKQLEFRELPPVTYDTEESMNVLRTNIAYSGSKKKTLLITSAGENEGKSTMTFQMARNFASTGQRVLLIDADLRKSMMTGTYGITAVGGSPLVGLADLLSGQVEPNDVVYKTSYENLCFTPIGHYVLNPTPLFESETFAAFLDFLKEYFDCILIDSPPLQNVIDAAIIAPACDGTILVVAAGSTTYDALNSAKKQLLRVKANILGCILNKAEHAHRGYYSKKSGYLYAGGKDEK